MVKQVLSFKGEFDTNTGGAGGCRRVPECELNTLQPLWLFPSQNSLVLHVLPHWLQVVDS